MTRASRHHVPDQPGATGAVALRIGDLLVRLERIAIVQGVTLEVQPGELVGLIGPNGSGKSTLLRAVYRHLRPAAGRVAAGGLDLWRLPAPHAARRVAAVPQESRFDFELTVRDVVGMGRTPHKRPFAPHSQVDEAIVVDALRQVGMTALADRPFASLSGGEKQRVLVGRALAQRTPILVLDEPTNHLDIRHQIELLDLIRACRLTTLAAMHDLNLAAAYCDRVYVLQEGRLIAGGLPAEIFIPAVLCQVFGVEVTVIPHPRTGRPHLVFDSLDGPEQPAGEPEAIGQSLDPLRS